jgi:hypothetical protein
MKTLDNPGSLTPYRFKTNRMILSSILSRLKSGEVVGAFNFFVTEAMNKWNMKKIMNEGGKFYCPLCQKHSGSFIHLSNSLRYSFNSVCPHCSSRARHRGLSIYYKEMVTTLGPEHKILHFAPEPVFFTIFRQKAFVYHTTDYILEDVDLPKQDVQHLTIPDNSYDVLLSNHVIEHVPDDVKALSEMCRITKKGGRNIITVPGNYKNEKTVYFNNLKHNGHYRDYGMDFREKMENVYSKVEVIDLHSLDPKGEMAIPEYELMFIGIK